MRKKFRYKNLLIHSSLQFCGNIEEYFAKNSEMLIAFVVMPRLRNKFNLVRVYREGRLQSENKVFSSENIILYYLFWYIEYIKILQKYSSKSNSLTVIAGHPITLFAMNIQRIVWNITFVYFIGDYFPGNSFILSSFERLKKSYHKSIKYAYYLSDGINRQMNGKIINTLNRKTIMWGVKPIKRRNILINKKTFNILFVGLIKESQGLEFLFKFLKDNKSYKLNIIGICDDKLYKKYKKIIKDYNIEENIFFPNTFYSEKQLVDIARKCDVGIAMYDINKRNPTYYTDPGKVKSYAEMGLPVIMSNVSGVAPYVKKFHSGILINRKYDDLGRALREMKSNYQKYIHGLKNFNNHFYYEKYYKNSFVFIEKL